MHGKCKNLLILLSLIVPSVTLAMDWSETAFEYLMGSGYRVTGQGDLAEPTQNRRLLTFTHANGWKYGDNYIWFDVENPTRKGSSVYTEIAPRLSFSKISGCDMKLWRISDVLAAATLEYGNASSVRTYLYGIGFDWQVPYFKFVQTNFYIRKVADTPDHGYQWTTAWSMPFSIADVKFKFDGFFDWSWKNFGTAAKNKHASFLTAPQLLLDVGNFFGSENTILAGVEYQYWNNKFGIKDKSLGFKTNERVMQFMVRWQI